MSTNERQTVLDTPRKLADFLVAHGLIDRAAVEDPEGYDNGRTMHLIAQAAEDLCAQKKAPTEAGA